MHNHRCFLRYALGNDNGTQEKSALRRAAPCWGSAAFRICSQLPLRPAIEPCLQARGAVKWSPRSTERVSAKPFCNSSVSAYTAPRFLDLVGTDIRACPARAGSSFGACAVAPEPQPLHSVCCVAWSPMQTRSPLLHAKSGCRANRAGPPFPCTGVTTWVLPKAAALPAPLAPHRPPSHAPSPRPGCPGGVGAAHRTPPRWRRSRPRRSPRQALIGPRCPLPRATALMASPQQRPNLRMTAWTSSPRWEGTPPLSGTEPCLMRQRYHSRRIPPHPHPSPPSAPTLAPTLAPDSAVAGRQPHPRRVQAAVRRGPAGAGGARNRIAGSGRRRRRSRRRAVPPDPHLCRPGLHGPLQPLPLPVLPEVLRLAGVIAMLGRRRRHSERVGHPPPSFAAHCRRSLPLSPRCLGVPSPLANQPSHTPALPRPALQRNACLRGQPLPANVGCRLADEAARL